MKLKTEIYLTWEEIQFCHFLGKTRQKRNEATHGKDKKQDPNSDSTDIHIQGAGGERAFCKMVNCYPELSTRPRRGGCDFINGAGQTIDVKATAKDDPHLRTPKYKAQSTCDIYVLIKGKIPNPIPLTSSILAKYEFIGWAWGDDLISDENIVRWEHQDTGKLISEYYYINGHFLNKDLEKIALPPISALSLD